jgi:DNA recombination protein RmuC
MSAVWLFIGLVVGAGVTALIMRERIRALRENQAQMRDNQAQMSDSFKAMSAEALDASVRQLAELAKTQLQSGQAEAKSELEKRQLAMEQLVRPLKDQLQRVDQQLLALNKERHESQGMLGERMRQLAEANEKLRSETGALVTALRKPNTRGQWGQMQLRKVVELAGMVRHCDFNEQASFAGDEQTLRPDMVVNLPGGKHVVVDAKAPLQGVLDAYEAPDEQTRAEAMQAHARLLRRHVKQLADKAYWDGMESAPDFVVLFLPGEHLYGAALDADPSLIEDAMSRRVLIATPTTLLALLHSVGYGWQQERVAESAQAISDLGRELHGRLAKLSGMLQTLGKRLNSTVNAYNDTVGSYERRVLPSARRFADHGAVASGAELTDVEQITETARDVALSPDDDRAVAAVDALDRPRALFEDPAVPRPPRHLRAADLRAADGS